MEGHRSFVTTPDDHSGIALTVTTVLACFSVLFLAVRIYIRAAISGRFGWDDWLCCLATATGVAQTAVTGVSISYGFGKALFLLDGHQIMKVQKLEYSAEIIFILTLALAKCSVAILLSQLKPDARFRKACWVLTGLCGAWGFASIMAVALRCDLSHPWQGYQAECPNIFVRWQTITAFDIITEVLLLAASIVLVFNVQLPLSAKAIVVTGFVLRVPVMVASGTRIHYIAELLKSDQPFLEGVTATICTQVEMHFALIAATIPSLKPFMSRFNTGWGTNAQSTADYAQSPYGSKTNYRPAGTRTKGSEKFDTMMTQDSLRPDMTRRTTEVSKNWPIQEEARSTSPSSEGTDPMVIKRTVSWEVIHEQDGKNKSEGPAGN